MDFSTPLDDTKIDPLRATDIMQMGGFKHDDLLTPDGSMKLTEILRYFSDKEDAQYVLNKFKMQTRNEGMLDHTYRFVKLRQQKDTMVQQLQGLDKELSLYD